VREVTRALMRVGEGWTYRGVGRLLRTDANRMKKTATGIEYASRDSSVVEDWIEIFAPVIFERYAPKEWPPLVMLDDLPFLVRVPGTTHKRVAFRIFAALGFWPNGRRRLLRLEAFADKTPANWAQFLTAIGGRPCGIICDNESGMLKGIEQVWPHTATDPAPIVWLSHWHVGNALLKLLRRYKRLTPPLSDVLQDAFMGTTEWQAFDTFARQSHFPELVKWLDNPAPLSWWAGDLTMSERILWQLERRRGIPSTTTALEQHLLVIKEKLNKRKFVFRNRERTNRMLQLMQLHLNDQANERTYSALIRRQLAKAQGHPAARRIITDPQGQPSLWV
jgi:hypothetical protein